MKLNTSTVLLFVCSLCSPITYSYDQTNLLGQWLTESLSLAPAPISGEEKIIKLDSPQGTLKGRNIDGINIFRGLQYAEAPIGNLRFAPPVATKSWTGVKDAGKFGPACIQPGEGNMSEDCLYLNVWAPDNKKEKKLPVYVFIHGGGFSIGSGSQAIYDGKALAKQGIVVVTLNYRLGTLGFLPSQAAFNQYHTTGNWGLLDIIEALKWVKNNISAFGGNPEHITIGGESAGSFAVSTLINSPLANGLFEQAIMESGSLPNIGAVAPFTAKSFDYAKQKAEQYFRKFDLKDNKMGLDKLRALPVDKILSTQLSISNAIAPQVTSFWPVPDGFVYQPNPSQQIKEGKINQVKLLAGYNSNEGSLFISPNTTEQDYQTFLTSVFGEHANEVATRFPIDTKHSLTQQMDNVITLSMLRSGVYVYADSLSKQNDVYLYHFGYSDPMIEPTGLGVVHGSELRYVFHNFMEHINKDTNATKMAKMIQTSWVNFIKSGNPNEGKSLPTTKNWKKYSVEQPIEMTLKPNIDVQIASDIEDIQFINRMLSSQK